MRCLQSAHERTHAPQQLPAYSITIGPGDQNCATSKPPALALTLFTPRS
jgi:hypothetical protein